MTSCGCQRFDDIVLLSNILLYCVVVKDLMTLRVVKYLITVCGCSKFQDIVRLQNIGRARASVNYIMTLRYCQLFNDIA